MNMDIGSGKGGPQGRLSNFTPRSFVFRGVKCASMEGLLASFKFDKPHIQVEVCKLTGLAAKRRGQKRNKAWKSKQTLWWNGIPYGRESPGYQFLLDEAFDALAQNTAFQRDLLVTQDAVLRHSIGRNKKSETVLTQREFCSRLTKIRERLQNESIN